MSDKHTEQTEPTRDIDRVISLNRLIWRRDT